MAMHRACRPGFALIGLLVVIAIILILALISIQGVGEGLGGDKSEPTGKKMDNLMQKAYGLTPCDRRRNALAGEIRTFHTREKRYPKTLRELGWLHGIPTKCPESGEAFDYDPQTGAVSCRHCQSKARKQQ